MPKSSVGSTNSLGAKALGSFVKNGREELGLDQNGFAELAGVSIKTLQRIENAEAFVLDSVLKKLAKPLRVDLKFFHFLMIRADFGAENDDITETIRALAKSSSENNQKVTRHNLFEVLLAHDAVSKLGLQIGEDMIGQILTRAPEK